MKKYIKESPIKTIARKFLREGELEAATASLAAKDLVDRLQDITSELGKMSNDELPALIDSIRSSFGADAATQYQNTANGVITALLDTVKQKKTELENATLVLTGDATAEGAPSDLALPDGEDNVEIPDMDNGALDSEGFDEPKAKNPLGRETRVPAAESYAKRLLHAKIVAINEALQKTDKKKKPVTAKRLAEELRNLVTTAIKEEASDKKKKALEKKIVKKDDKKKDVKKPAKKDDSKKEKKWNFEK